jgi:restriction system protein
MARRRSTFAEIQRERARHQRELERAQAAQVRQQMLLRRAAEQAARAAQRAAEQAARAGAKARADAEKRRKQAYLDARLAEVNADNADVQTRLDDLRGLLTWTLNIDDHVDFRNLKRVVEHPPIELGGLDRPLPPAVLEPLPVEPSFDRFRPVVPTGLSRLFGGKAQYERAMQQAQQAFAMAYQGWQQSIAAAHQRFAQSQAGHAAAEQDRLRRLAEARRVYELQCAERQHVVDQHNAELDEFEALFLAAEPKAVVEYFDMVLGNSVYPDDFPQHFRLAYVPESKQLVVEYDLPPVAVVPAIKEYRYLKTRDEKTTTARPAKEIKDLYASVVAQVTLRTVHELFEADRNGLLETIVFNGVVHTVDPGTGASVSPCLVTLRTTRNVFDELDLARVQPLACLAHLNASVSKRPDELAPVRPVLEFDMVDKRFIEETDVLSELDRRPNLLDLTPIEFEGLIQNLFAKMGLDTKQTRASRDGGVDCVAFDPRPIFGGKVVIQAKRYRGTVDVSSVRDLFGTLQNEGASKGILVTTSGYGPASYEFASGKPLELIDGSNLLYLLAEHAAIEARIVDTTKV